MMTNLKLPGMDSSIVREAEYFIKLFDGPDEIGERINVGRAAHRIHVSRKGGNWEWAHLLHMVSGWTVVAAGMLDGTLCRDHAAAAEYIAEQARGADGDGFDRLTHDAYMQISREAHIRRERDRTEAYCGVRGRTPAVFSTREKGHVEQHCIGCDRAYRAEHYGRVAVTH
jgi:hypothetical protein